ncbi:MAG: hypothetical protein FRX48_05178 [Lasallia pustulata]|uniref:HMG box domain-containing protein n=1 Tax=Lasallia pustulata TaxID=136370 RepID=A0A5M8PQA2_9LECA|nr:MAG: hypothetical protein FRX48_05178 [Lasallia pustulata]
MSITAMVKQGPPSPAPSNGGELQYGLHHLVQHNAATHYQPQQYTFEDAGYVQSGTNTSYGSPPSGHLMADQYGRVLYRGPYRESNDVGLGIQYSGYESPTYYQNNNSGYYGATPDRQNYQAQGYHVSTPPTPTASDQSSRAGGRRTRSGRPIAPNRSSQISKSNTPDKTRTSGSPRVKKSAKHSKSDRSKVPKIDAPLSELTKDFEHIPIRNMEEWVHRPVEVRLKEVEKRKGYVTRPMNSFMLYRSAYAERTKLWCLQNNHQIVSSVSGESWPLEPPKIREQYNEYARVERDNHQKAHPGYKFSPSKAQGLNRKRKGASEAVDEEESSDLDDPDFDWRPSAQKKSKARHIKRVGRDAGYPANSATQDLLGMMPLELNTNLNRSSYQATNPGKPLPTDMASQELYGQYLQTTIHPNINSHNIEDVRFRKTDIPSMSYGPAQPVIGLPGAHHYELLDEHSNHDGPPTLRETQVDPQLLAYDDDCLGLPHGLGSIQQYNEYDQESLFGNGSQQLEYQEVPTYNTVTDPWQIGGEVGHVDAADDFDRWMEENNNR